MVSSIEIIYKGYFAGSFGRRDSRLSSLVLSMVIFFRITDECRCVFRSVAGNEFFSDIILVILSVSFTVSLYFFIHGFLEAVIRLINKMVEFLVLLRSFYLNIIILSVISRTDGFF